MSEESRDPLTPEETAEVREILQQRRFWKSLWKVLATLADRLKIIITLLPWLLSIFAFFNADKIREYFGW